MDFDEDEARARLPGLVYRANAGPVVVDYSTTRVERYVKDHINSLEAIDAKEADLEPLLEFLFSYKVTPPVNIDDIVFVLEDLEPAVKREYLKIKDFFPRVLMTLNGPDYRVVSDAILKRAWENEEAVGGLTHGWGVSDPPMHAIAHRLLVVSGLDPRMLPAYQTLPPSQRPTFMAAWAGACKRFGWKLYQPPKDVKAEERRKKMGVSLGPV